MDQASTLRKMTKDTIYGTEEPFVKGRLRIEKPSRIIAITSGKGGVGKTNIVANLAFALTQIGKTVMVLDADLGLGNLDVLLGLTPKFNLYHVLKGEKDISEIIVKGPGMMDILPASSGIQELTELNKEQKLRLLTELAMLDNGIDIFLIDTAAGISSNVMYFNVAAQEIMVVVSPEPTSITDSYALMKVLSKEYSEKRFNLLVNCVVSANEAMSVFRKLSLVAERFLDISINYLGYIVRDENIPKAVRQQRVLGEAYPNSQANRCFDALAKRVCELPVPANSKGNIQFFLGHLLQVD
ncbi:MAG: MinD/ParA family protein [Pseudomonadota bacterium]